MQFLIALAQNLLTGLQAAEIPLGTLAVVGGGLLAAFGAIYWHTLFWTLFWLGVAFTAGNLVSLIPTG